MKNFALILLSLLLLVPSVAAQTITTAAVSITNTAGTTNGQTIAINASTRTWTNSVQVPSVQILTNETSAGAATNLFTQLALNPVSGVTLTWGSSTGIVLQSFPGSALTVTISEGWGLVSYTTNVLTSARTVRVPLTVEAAGPRAEIASQLVTGQNDFSTNSFFENSITVSNLVGRTNAQTISGNKTFTGTIIGTNLGSYIVAGVFQGTNFTGTINRVTNGIWFGGGLNAPLLTNGINHGNAFRSPGSGTASEQFGTSAAATGTSATALGASATAGGDQSTAIGYNAVADNSDSVALGSSSSVSADTSTAIGASASASHEASVALGAFATTTAGNQIRLGTATEYVSIPGGLHVAGAITNATVIGTNTVDGHTKWIRKAVTTLANGNNAAVPISTNTFVEVSGPSGAFAIIGLANGSDGRFLIIVNQTGQNMTIGTEGGAAGNDPVPENRIISLTGADRATTGNGAAILIYSAAASRWILISLDP